MTWPPHIKLLEWDETAVGNLVAVPLGHLYRVTYGLIKFVASSDVATRTVLLQIRPGWAVNSTITISALSATQSQTKTIVFGLLDDVSAGQHNEYQRLPGQDTGGMWLPEAGEMDVSVTNEQAADDWDAQFVVEDYVVAPA